METALKFVSSGYLIGVSCMVYLAIRSGIARAKGGEERQRVSWPAMLLFSTGISYVWSVLGAGLYFVLPDATIFLRVSLVTAGAVGTLLLFSNTSNKLDKLAVNTIVFGGMGVLIPYLL